MKYRISCGTGRRRKMLNKEKYAKEIAEIACEGYKVAIVHGKPKACGICFDCDF
jgi:hypothetical protein